MGQIDRHNCEAFFLDYHEGNLSPVQQGEVLLFLEENPDLKNVFEEYENIFLEQEKICFPGKEVMKKKYSAEGIESLLSSEITSDNCDQFFIAFAEGQLSSERILKLNSFLESNPTRQKEFELFKKAKLSAEKIPFEEKQSLKKSLITKANREEYFIRSAEKDLNRAEGEQLKLFLQTNPECKKEFELFAKTILPFEQINFADKDSLKKKERNPVFVSIFSQRTAYYAAAAAILLLLGLFFIFRNDNPEKQMLSDKGNSSAKQEDMLAPGDSKSLQIEAQKLKENGRQPEGVRQNPIMVKKNSSSVPMENEKGNKPLQPVIFEDEEKLLAEKEKEKPVMMEPEVLASETISEKKHESNEAEKTSREQAAASANAKPVSDEYQTLGSFARKQIKKALGIQKLNSCEAEDKLTVWDFAMAAKNGIQNLVGTKAIDVNKFCEGSEAKAEYVFSAGGFEISRKAKNKM